MWNHKINEDLFEKFGKNAKIAGAILALLGVIGIIFPGFMTMATVYFVSWLLLFGAFSTGYFTYMSDKRDWLGWLKVVLMFGVSLYMLFFPLSGAATLGLLFSIYFFMDAFAGVALASNQYPAKGWWLWALNGLLSFILGVIFVVGWPFNSLYLVGVFVGISIFFDGIALFSGGRFLQNMTKL